MNEKQFPETHWLRLDEIENAIDNLEMVYHFLIHVRGERKWKWVVLAAHQALYGFAICAANVPPDYLVARPNKRFPEGKLISIWEALEIAQKPIPKNAPNEFFKVLQLTPAQERAINILVIDFRNEFEHFKPKGWSIEVSGFPKILKEIIEVIRFLSLDSHRVNTSIADENKISTTIARIENWFSQKVEIS